MWICAEWEWSGKAGGACGSCQAQETSNSCLYLLWRNCTCRLQAAVSISDAIMFVFFPFCSQCIQWKRGRTNFLFKILDIDSRGLHALCEENRNYDHWFRLLNAEMSRWVAKMLIRLLLAYQRTNASLWWCSFVEVNNANYPTSLITFHERPTDGGPGRRLMKLSAHSVSRSHECFYGIFRSVNSGILWPFELHSVEWTRPCCSPTSLIVPSLEVTGPEPGYSYTV